MTMKIQGPHPSINHYKQTQQQHFKEKSTLNKDQLNISDAARQMQKSNGTEAKRTDYINEIKNQVQTGNYEIEPEKIAEKIVDFWS